MERPARPVVVYDRIANRFANGGVAARLHASAIQLSHRALAPIGYVGISRVHALINRIMKPATDTQIVEGGFHFTFPSNDYYWNRLLDRRWQYEPEIDLFLNAMSDLPFVFLDLGANFGFWSARLGSGMYGDHQVVAVEASSAAVPILRKNVEALKHHVSVHHRAISDVSGQKVTLFGDRHAGFSIDNSWYGASTTAVNEVETIAIDDLVAQEGLATSKQPILIKLDVEGAELKAIRGAAKTLAGPSAVIIEDVEKKDCSDAVKVLHDELGCDFYLCEGGKIVKLNGLQQLRDVKRNQQSLQWLGQNLVATRSQVWRDHISGKIVN